MSQPKKNPEHKVPQEHKGGHGNRKFPERASYSETETRRGDRSADAVAKCQVR